MKQVKMILLLLIIILAVTAAYQNITPIKGKYITLGLDLYKVKWETTPIPLGFVIVMCFFAGALIMLLVDIPVWFRRRKQVRALEKELAAYRSSGAGSSYALENSAEPAKELPDDPEPT
jgi:uncharacterized integral membrane protein